MKNKFLYFINKTDSTNNYLKQEIRKRELENDKLEEFYTIFTAEQTHGRGLGNNQWESEFGKNLLVSFFFIPPLQVAQQFIFNQFFSLTIKKLLEPYISDVKVKWPNDIYVENQKIAGILIEHFIEGNKITKTIAGVGLNVNQTHFSTSINNPTSLKILTGKDYNIEIILNDFFNLLMEEYQFLKQQNYNYFHEKYLHSLYRFKEKSKYLIDGKEKFATIQGIDTYGQLILEEENGNIQSYGMKEVKFM